MRYLSWIITLPIAVLAVLFAISNRDPVALALWPLPFQIAVPVFVAVLVPLVLGFLLGGLVAWAGSLHWRRLARRRGQRLAALGDEVKQHRERERRVAETAAREAESARLQAAAAAAEAAAQQDRPRIEAAPVAAASAQQDRPKAEAQSS